MASFSVDITEIVFAGARKGYKDITITGMPQAGVSCTITGTDTSAFNYKIPGDDQNVYRVYTTGLTTDSYTPYNAVFKITNSSDSSDYVEVQLHQLRSGYYDLEGNHRGCVVNVVCDSPMFINDPKDWSDTGTASYIEVYVNQNNGGDSTAHCTVLLDSVWRIPTSLPSWIALTQMGYTDTGFKKVELSVTNNYDGPRNHTLNFGNDNNLDIVRVYQDGYPSTTSGCTETLTFPKSGGTLTATLKHPSMSNYAYLIAETGALYNIYGENCSVVKDSSSKNSSVFSITIPANTSDGEIRTFVDYVDISGSTAKYLGHTTIIQEGNAPTPTLTVDPSVLTYPSTGGGRVLDVTYATSLSTNESSFPDWLVATYVSTGQSSGSYTITAASNTSTASRSFDFNLADVNMSLTVPITQDAGSSAGSLSVTPSSLSFGADASYADISLTYGGTYFNTAADEVYTWVTVNMSDKGGGQATGTVSVPVNNTTASRKGNIYFTDEEGGSIALPVEQSGIQAVLSANPSSLNIPAEGGTVTTAVTYVGSLSAASLPSWLSETHTDTDSSHRTYSLTAASNGPTQERTFNWRLDDDYNNMYVFISQAAKIQSSLVISPTSQSVGSPAGTVDITVRSTNISEISYDITGDWITYSSKSGSVYTFSYEQNHTTSVREGTITFSGGGISRTFKLTQREGEASLVISPESKTVDREAGSVVITVSSSGISDINYTISDTWIQFFAKTVNKYKFSYDRNGTTSTREGTITFSGGGISRTFTLTQETEAKLAISPAYKIVDNTSGTVDITVISQGISDISYDIRDSWIKYKSKSGSVYTFSYDKNTTTSVREGTVIFSGGGESSRFTLTQWAQTENFYIYPSNNIFNAYGKPSGASYTNLVNAVYPVTTVVSDSWITASVDETDNSVEVTVSSNNTTGTDLARTGTIVITDNSGASATYSITQAGDDIMFNPNPVTFKADGSGGPYELDVYCHTTLHTEDYAHPDSNTIPSWLTFKLISGGINGILHYSITASKNTSSTPRSARVLFKETVDTEHSGYLNVTQEGEGGSDPLSVSPTELNYTAAGGTKSVTVSGGNGTINVNNGSFPSWLSVKSAGGGVYNLTTTKNTGKARSFAVWFTDNTSTVTMNVYQQAGDTPGPGPGPGPGPTPVVTGSLKAYPMRLRYYSDGGSIAVSFTNRPRAGIGYTITYTDGTGWLSAEKSDPNVIVTATKNTGIRRRASIKFYDLGDSKNYVIVPVIQGSEDGYSSIWMDDLFYPAKESWDGSGNYYYRIVDKDTNYEYFSGVAVNIFPGTEGEGLGGIDIPRLVEYYINTTLEEQKTDTGWGDMSMGYCTVDVYNMTTSGYPGTVEATFKYWNDWSRFEKKYDYTRTLNDPINSKGCDNMIIPFCVYYDESSVFSIVDTERNGNVNTKTLSTPSKPFMMRTDSYYDSARIDYRQDGQILFSYDMTHCGQGALIYRNRFGGWDSFLIEGNISKTDNYTKQNYRKKGGYNLDYSIDTLKYIDEKRTEGVDIDTTYQAYTGWLTDEESERLVFHLLSSPTVFFQNLNKANQLYDTDSEFGALLPVRITASSSEYKKFRNGKRLVNYLITFEKCNIEQVRR